MESVNAFNRAGFIPNFLSEWYVTRNTAPLSMPPEKHTPIGSSAGRLTSHCLISWASERVTAR